MDIVLTTRELAKMIKESRIQINELEEDEFDEPFGISTGAVVIFGSSGGVMETALRTVYEIATKKEFKDINLKEVRGMKGIKEAKVNVGKIYI